MIFPSCGILWNEGIRGTELKRLERKIDYQDQEGLRKMF